VLREFPAAEPVYAVLDGARDRRVRGWVLDTRAPSWCLYRGRLVPELDDAAPRLLRLLPGKRYTADFFRRYWGQSWGIVISSTAPAQDLRRHLRKLLLARTEDGRTMIFRYYDPRVLRVYLPTCTAKDGETFFGPVSAMAAEGRAADTFHVFRRNGEGVEQREVSVKAAP
jgi:hypothetical protein